MAAGSTCCSVRGRGAAVTLVSADTSAAAVVVLPAVLPVEEEEAGRACGPPALLEDTVAVVAAAVEELWAPSLTLAAGVEELLLEVGVAVGDGVLAPPGWWWWWCGAWC